MIRALCLIVLAGFVVLTTAGSARADDAVGLSLDGHQWSSSLTQPLFDPAFRWVPGDTETRSLWVRNQGPTGASMQIALQAPPANPLLAGDDLKIDARAQDGAWLALPTDGSTQTLVDRTLAKGDRVRLDLRVAFVPGSTNQTQLRELPLKFVVQLTQARPGGGGPGGDAGGGGDLPDTGNTVQPWQLWLAGALIGGGLVLVVRRRKEEEADG